MKNRQRKERECEGEKDFEDRGIRFLIEFNNNCLALYNRQHTVPHTAPFGIISHIMHHTTTHTAPRTVPYSIISQHATHTASHRTLYLAI
jgi:hypothetical protein